MCHAALSGVHALTNFYPSVEFGGYRDIRFRFTTEQSSGSVKAGLDYARPFGVYAHMRAYSSEGPQFEQSDLIALDDVQLGTGPTGLNYTVDELVLLRGSGWDPEDGTVTGKAPVWKNDAFQILYRRCVPRHDW